MCYGYYMVIIKCKKCREDKPKSSFRIWRGKRNKWCDDCRARNNEWYKKDHLERKTKAKLYYQRIKHNVAQYRSDLRLDRKYSLTREEWKELLALQKGLCGICKEEMKNPCVDHKTGKVRGLLHQRCNLRLQVIEDTDFLLNAQTYLDSME